jgi:hypothetical protein
MSWGSAYNLNSRLTYIEYLLNNGPLPPALMPNLEEVLTDGNSAGGLGITNLLSESFSSGINITDASNNSIISNTSTGDMAISCITNQLITNSFDNTQINAGVGFRVIAGDYVSLVANNDNMSLQADDDISLTSLAKGIILTAGTGDAGVNDITLNTIANTTIGSINLNSAGNVNLNGVDINLNSVNSIYETAQLVRLRDGINGTEILLDMGTTIDQVPKIKLEYNGLQAFIYKDNDLHLFSDQATAIETEKLMVIQTNNDNISLLVPNGKVFVERNLGTGDGEIIANVFTGSLNGNATSANTSSSSTTSSFASVAGIGNQIATTGISSSGSLFYLPIVSNNTTNPSQIVYTDNNASRLTYNITTGNLTSPLFTGSLIGNANTASSASIASQANGVFTTIDTTNPSNSPIFFGNSSSGNQATKVNSNLYFVPTTNTLNCTTFSGALTGTSTNANAVNTTTDNTSTTCYIPFTKLSAGSARPLYVDDTTGPLSYNPSTSTLTSTNFNGLCSTTGLVFLQTLTGTITGAATATTYTFPSIFNTTYKNYKILFTFGENSFSAYPFIGLNGFSGTNVPTTGDIYGYDMTSGLLTAVNLSNQTLSTTPLQLTGACLPNLQIELEVLNVGYTTLQSNNIVKIVSNSVYNNPGVKGIRNITAMINQNSSSTITGLSLQSILGVGNNPTWTAKIYGYK